MDEQQLQAYLSLIQELLTCRSGEEAAILSNHPELVDEGLVQVMRDEAEKRAQQGRGNVGWLRDFADTIEAVNYELPRLETKSTADALLDQGFQQYQQSQYSQAWESLQQSLALYEDIGDKANIALCWGQLGCIERDRGNWEEAEGLYQQSLALRTELGDRAGMATSWGVLGDIQRNRGNWDEAEGLYQQSLALSTELGDRAGMASSWGVLGDIQRNRGNWDEAERLYQQSLALRTELGDRKGMATSWGQLGDIQRNRGNWEEAERLYQQSLALRTELGDRSGMATSWGVLGDIQRNRGNWEEAERLYQQSLALRTELGDRKGMATSWGVLGDIQRNRGNWDEAEGLYQQSLALRTELGDRAGMATSWGVLGDIQRNRGNWEEAERLYQQCLAIETELGDRAGMATSWGVLGDIQRNRGNWEEAERLYQQSLALSTELGDRAGMATSWGQLGGIQQLRGNWEEAERLYQQSLALRTELGDRKGMATTWGSLGDIQRNRGNWEEAERLYQQSLALRTELGDRAGMAAVWGVLGDIQNLRGNWEEAERLYQQSLALRTELGDRAGMAAVWGVLGDIQNLRGNWEEAERLYQQSLALRTELGDRSWMAAVWGVLGDIQRFRGNWDEAERLYQQCLEVMTELGDRAGMADVYNVLAFVHQHLNRIPEALAAWKEGLTICPPDRFPLEALDIGRNLGDAAFEIQDWDTAIYGYEAAIEAVETRCTFTDSYSEKQQRREAAVDLYPQLVQACINAEDIGKALASVERSKSRNLIELLSNRDLYPKGDIPPELLKQLDRLRREVTAKQRLIETLETPTNPDNQDIGGLGQRGSSAANFTPEVMNSLRQEYEQAQKDLSQLLETINTYDPNFSLTQRVPHIQFSKIQELLDKDTLLMEWYLSPQGIYTFIVRGETGEISVHLSPPEHLKQLQELRETYLQTYQRHHSDDWETNLDHFLRRLRDILELPQLLPQIPPTYRRLIVVPYRELHLFPLHALPLGDGDEPDYLADRFPLGVTYSPSCQFLEVSQRQRKTSNRQRFFAIQNPTEDLDYADLEVEAILANFSTNARYLARQQASKTSLNQNPHRQAFQGADYLHFAGHGAFNFNSPLLSPLVLAGAKVSVSDSQGRTLSEETTPSEPAETRFLPWRKGTQIDLSKCYTLGELFELDLPACRLVILSACETGLTDFSPNLEEYISLGLGFLYAGAANVICSLWAVNDVSTAILMVKLYEEMQTQPSVALALKQAQEWMRAVTKQELTAWLNEQDSAGNPYPKAKLRDNLGLGLKRADYRPYKHPIHWGAFCAIGV
ncbi:CHAT domain-containing protein [Limnospira indica]|uniref:TPR domain protein n=1 Tax=Limnospira indica PCC 8005 TaxID=376219 RepID=A0A9P1NYS9_9CYAN|nr:CHAT domain-containing tetratricopeptide repeat protein [Limnospira indica]CDM95454.1 TPR domain protein [Limnospira indica PCC 8005]